MGAKILTIVLDKPITFRDDDWNRLLNFEEDLKRHIQWHEELAMLSGFEDGLDKIIISIPKKRNIKKVIDITEKTISHHNFVNQCRIILG